MLPPDVPRFDHIGAKAKAFAEDVLSDYVGEAHEEVGMYVNGFCRRIDTSLKRVTRFPEEVTECVYQLARDVEEIIPELHTYGVKNTTPLDDIQTALEDWLSNHGRGRGFGPQPAPM